jgi:hypothetical protein
MVPLLDFGVRQLAVVSRILISYCSKLNPTLRHKVHVGQGTYCASEGDTRRCRDLRRELPPRHRRAKCGANARRIAFCMSASIRWFRAKPQHQTQPLKSRLPMQLRWGFLRERGQGDQSSGTKPKCWRGLQRRVDRSSIFVT